MRIVPCNKHCLVQLHGIINYRKPWRLRRTKGGEKAAWSTDLGNNYTGVGATRYIFFSHRVQADVQPGAQLCVSDFECCRNRRVCTPAL